MSADADLAADLLINGIALAAVLFASFALGAAGSAVGRRLRRLLVGIAFLLALRMVNWMAPTPLLAIPVTIAASWLPLLGLRMAEQLVRRHAPALLKQVALGGAVALSAAALLTGALFPAQLMLALASFQALLLFWIVLFLASARSRQLAPAETRLADTFALALLLAIPFAISDFRDAVPGLPVRMGGLGVLMFVLAASRLLGGMGSPRALIGDVLGLALCGVIVGGGALVLAPSSEPVDAWRIGAVAAAAAAALQIVQRLREAGRADRQRPSLLAAFRTLPDDADADTLAAAHPVTAAGTLVERSGLELYDQRVVASLARHRLVTAATPLEPDAVSAARNIFAEHGATHLVRLARVPPRFLALNAGQIGSSGPLDLELDMLARLAARSER